MTTLSAKKRIALLMRHESLLRQLMNRIHTLELTTMALAQVLDDVGHTEQLDAALDKLGLKRAKRGEEPDQEQAPEPEAAAPSGLVGANGAPLS